MNYPPGAHELTSRGWKLRQCCWHKQQQERKVSLDLACSIGPGSSLDTQESQHSQVKSWWCKWDFVEG